MDPELREALNQVVVDLRGEIQTLGTDLRGEMQTLGTELRGEMRSGDAETRETFTREVADLRGEIRSVDAGLREALNQAVVGLRGEIRSADAETRTYTDDRIQTSTASFLLEMGQVETRMRRHFDVVGDSLRSDIRAVVEGMAASREQMDRRIDEEARGRGGLEGRVVRLEVRVKDLEDGRKPRRTGRRPPS